MPFLWLLLGGTAIAGLFAALYLGGAETLTVCLLLLVAASIWCIKADTELLRLWRLFALAYFCVLPAGQLIARDEIYLTLLSQQNSATIEWFVLNIIGIWAMNFALIAMRGKRTASSAVPDMRPSVAVVSRWVYGYAVLSLAALAFIYLKLGGYAQIAQLYAVRLETSVTKNDPLEGLGVVQAFANTAPLWVFVCVMLRPWRSRLIRIFAFVQLIVLGWLSSGVFGNRQGIVFVVLFACLTYHTLVTPISRRAAKIVGICVAVGGLAMIPMKFGIDYSQIENLSKNFADQRMLQLSMGRSAFSCFEISRVSMCKCRHSIRCRSRDTHSPWAEVSLAAWLQLFRRQSGKINLKRLPARRAISFEKQRPTSPTRRHCCLECRGNYSLISVCLAIFCRSWHSHG
ncbi:hypothetical protein [Paraburkholderia terrae]|uniref:hypothetical protein n=1 Tax=Paraburkholderia terrae TaxID=311230 RepID=UPI0020BD71C0|nr:hypothetical protein [Paraburkholderia terrae]